MVIFGFANSKASWTAIIASWPAFHGGLAIRRLSRKERICGGSEQEPAIQAEQIRGNCFG
jgi:hypothetical protein